MNYWRKITAFINVMFGKIGYMVVHCGGSRNPVTYSEHLGAQFAYETILLEGDFAPWAIDADFLKLYDAIRNNTLVDIYRCWELYQLVREVSPIHGDIIEIGAWRGGTGAVLATAAAHWKPKANVWICDTFYGVVKAGSFDSMYKGGEHSDSSIQVVNQLLSALGLQNWKILQGVFPDETAAAVGARQFALCHIDVDAYQSARDVVEFIDPMMPSGGVVVFDDYGFKTCQGITRLVDELRAEGGWIMIYNLNKHAILIKR